MHSLPLFVRLDGRPVILLGDGEPVEAKRRLLIRAGAVCVGEEAQSALAIVAIEDDALAHAAIARLKARGILVNAVDRPALCDFTLPAIVDRAPVLIAIGTGGASAGLAKALRIRLEALLPQSLGGLAEALGSARTALRARFPDARTRRLALDAALDPGGPLDPLSDTAPDAVADWLVREDATPETRLIRLSIPSNDPDDLTLRTARLLGKADHIFHQSGIAPAILNRARADAARTVCQQPPEMPLPGLTLFLEIA